MPTLKMLVTGTIASPFGVHGVVKVRPASGDGEHFKHLSEVQLGVTEPEKKYFVETVETAQNLVYMKFRGIETPEAAKTLSGLKIFVPRELAAPLKNNEYYIEDLKGLSLYAMSGDCSGVVAGKIEDIIEGGGGFLAEILRSADNKKILVPWRNEFFGDVNLDARTVPILQPWILED